MTGNPLDNPAIHELANQHPDQTGVLGEVLNHYFQPVSVVRCKDCRRVVTVGPPPVEPDRFDQWQWCSPGECFKKYELPKPELT